jgi:ParB family chromosome partitioning protein
MKTVQKTAPKAGQPVFEKESYLMVPPSVIIHDENVNPRTEYGDIEELMTSILENGIRNPLKGYEKDGKIVLKDGHRRMRAVRLALERGKKIERVPVIVEKRTLNEEERTLEFMIYNDGKPLTMLEQSEVIKRLLNFGWKVTDVVKKTGKARGYIENLILLTRCPLKLQGYIKEGKISAHAVIQIMQAVKGNADEAVKEVEEAIKTASASGKAKATPKHVSTKQVKSQNYGKFYRWVEEIADALAGRKDLIREREEVISKLMVAFENGQKSDLMLKFFLNDKGEQKAPLTPKKAPAKTKAKKK